MSVSALSPAQGPITGGTFLTVVGTTLAPTTEILISFTNGTFTEFANGTFASASHIECVTPSFAGHLPSAVVTVEVALNGQQFTTGGVTFFYYGTIADAIWLICAAEPILTTISPASGPNTGSTALQIKGLNLVHTGAITVKFTNNADSEIVPGTFVDGHIVCTSPVFAAGPTFVSVALNGEQFSNSIPFLYYGTCAVMKQSI